MTNTQLPAHHPSAHRRPVLGLPILAIIGLAALAVPRVILHDLHIAEEGDAVTWVLAIGPWALWIAAAVMKKVPHPFLTVLVTGVIFGAMLVITHQLLWGPAFGSNPPQIGTGPLAHVLPRIAGVVSGLFTGTMMGALGGLVAWGIQALTRRRA